MQEVMSRLEDMIILKPVQQSIVYVLFIYGILGREKLVTTW